MYPNHSAHIVLVSACSRGGGLVVSTGEIFHINLPRVSSTYKVQKAAAAGVSLGDVLTISPSRVTLVEHCKDPS